MTNDVLFVNNEYGERLMHALPLEYEEDLWVFTTRDNLLVVTWGFKSLMTYALNILGWSTIEVHYKGKFNTIYKSGMTGDSILKTALKKVEGYALEVS